MINEGERTSQMAPNQPNPLSRKYFTGSENIGEFLEDLEEYFLLNKIADADKLAFLKCSIKGDAKVWCNTIALPSFGATATYVGLVTKLKEHFSQSLNKSDLRKEFYSHSMSIYEKPSNFLLRKLELARLLELNMSYAALMEVITPLFTIVVQDYLDIKQVANLDNLFVTLRNYEQRHPPRQNVSPARFSREPPISPPLNSRERNPDVVDNRNVRSFPGYGRFRGHPGNQGRGSSRNFQSRRHDLRLVSDQVEDGDRSCVDENPSIALNSLVLSPVELPKLLLLLDGVVLQSLWDTGAGKCFISWDIYQKYFSFKMLKPAQFNVLSAQGSNCVNKGRVDLSVEIRTLKTNWSFYVIKGLTVPCIIGVDFMNVNEVNLDFSRKELVIHKELEKVESVQVPPLEVNLDDSSLTRKEQAEFREFLNGFKDLLSDTPGLTHVACHEIDTAGEGPVFSKPYRYDQVKQSIIDYHVDKMLREDVIIPIVSPYASPVVLCKKNNGKPAEDPEGWRFAIDYRKLNAITRYPQYPLPVIDDLLSKISETNFMSTLDLTSGYFQIAMKSSDIEKTAFITKNGCYAFKRMAFGLSGAPATFQRTMEAILKPVLGKFVHVYLDDVIITSASFKEHLNHLEIVFSLLRNAGLTLKGSKCHFARKEIKYLGVKITNRGIKIDNEKITAIKEMERPKTSKQVSRFLGLCTWFSKFIPHFAEICEPLFQLKRKRVKFVWSDAAQKAFDTLKNMITSPPVLAHPDYNCRFELATDASSCGIGAVLIQKGRPIAFASRTLSSAERNYPITERECLAVIWALNKFRVYFTSIPVTVVTDHSALTKLTNGKGLSARMIRWALKLAEFNIVLEHRAGTENVVADALSRCPQFERMEVQCLSLPVTAIRSRDQLIREQKADETFGKIYRYLHDPDSVSNVESQIFSNWSRDFKIVDGLLFYSKTLSSSGELKVVIPSSLQKAILSEFHDNALAGHLGIRKTLSKLQEACYFPHMRKIITKYVSSCDACQKYNYKNLQPAGKLLPISVKFPNQIVGIDLIGPYPVSNPSRYRYVLVMTDYFSKWVEFVPLRKASAHAVATAFFDNYISKFGAPVQVVSDHGKQFVSDIFQALCRKLEIRHVLTVPYRPQSNQAERINRTLIQMIATYVNNHHENWDQFLQHFAFALRTAVHDSTGKTPAELFLGRKILTPFQRLVLVPEMNNKFKCSDVEKLIKEAQEKIGRAQKAQARYYNMRRRVVDIRVGDQVLLETHYLSSKVNKKVAKFGPKFSGPYDVLRVLGNNLVLNVNGRETTVNLDQVRVYKSRPSSSSSNSSAIISGGSQGTNQRSAVSHSVHPSAALTSNSSRTSQSSSTHQRNADLSAKCKPSDGSKSKNRAPGATTPKPQCSNRTNDPTRVPNRNYQRVAHKRTRPDTGPNPPLKLQRRQGRKRQPSQRAQSSDLPPRSRPCYSARLPAPKRSVGTDHIVPPAQRPRTLYHRPPPVKRPMSTNTSTSRAHHEKMIAVEDSSRESYFSPPHPYRTRLQAHRQASIAHSSPYSSTAEKEFVQSFWNPPRPSSDSVIAEGSSL